jgi:hypothetical protein
VRAGQAGEEAGVLLTRRLPAAGEAAACPVA